MSRAPYANIFQSLIIDLLDILIVAFLLHAIFSHFPISPILSTAVTLLILPTLLFLLFERDERTIHDFLEHALKITGQSNRFEDLACKLFIIAVDLDSGTAVRFGKENHHDVTISRAVQASAALPSRESQRGPLFASWTTHPARLGRPERGCGHANRCQSPGALRFWCEGPEP